MAALMYKYIKRFPLTQAAERGTEVNFSISHHKNSIYYWFYKNISPASHKVMFLVSLFPLIRHRCQYPDILSKVQKGKCMWIYKSLSKINLLVTRCTNKFNIQKLYVLSTLYLCVL
jgi:hypothetical protein